MPGVNSETLIAGPYTATWNSVALGIFEGDEGLPALEHTSKSEPVNNTSAYGKSTIDEIGQGADWFLPMTCLEYRTGVISAFWPYGAAILQMGTIGLMLTSLSQALVLTAVSGTSASAAPATVTFTKSFPLPGFTTKIKFGPTLRKVPLRFRLFPYILSGSTVGWGLTT